MAFDAEIWSFNVFSRQRSNSASVALGADVLAALNNLVTAPPGFGVVEITVSTSSYPGTCTGTAVPSSLRATYNAAQTAVNTLYDMGIAVVAPTGNDSYVGQIGFPSCLAKVVKVGAIQNDGNSVMDVSNSLIGTENATFSNLPSPAHMNSGFVWFAPGGGKKYGQPDTLATKVRMPAVGSTSPFASAAGTSYASPHIAGVFALYKSSSYVSSTVAEIGNYLNGIGRTYNVKTTANSTDLSGVYTPGMQYLTYRGVRFTAL